jgi:nucleoside-diphosphate-sugar epimerase
VGSPDALSTIVKSVRQILGRTMSEPHHLKPPLRLVVGCGYLGERVARRWLDRGDRVMAATRSPTRAEVLAAARIEPLILDVTAESPGWERLFAESGPGVATIFWAVGFDRSGGASYHDVHVAGLGKLLAAAVAGGSRPRVIFSSSTGVWGDERGGIVSEATPPDPTREAGRVLVAAEHLLATHPAGPGTALRFAGLYGPGRLPRLADLRAGRPIAADPDSWLNLVHIDDAAPAGLIEGFAVGGEDIARLIDIGVGDRGAEVGLEDRLQAKEQHMVVHAAAALDARRHQRRQ